MMKAAVIQMVSGKDVDQNLKQAESLLLELKSQHPDVVVLPEMFACLGIKNQAEIARERFHDQDVLATLSAFAKTLNTTLVAGSMPLTDKSKPEKVRAACLVFGPEGQLQTRYDKIHLFDVDVADSQGSYRESDTFTPGDQPQVTQVDGHTLGLSICYDLRFPELYQQYQKQGCELITAPSAFTYTTGQAHWELLLRTRAVETQSFVLAANQGGIHEDGRQTWGHSMIVGPDGQILTEVSTDGEGWAVAELDFSKLNQVRASMPIMQHKRL